MIRRGDSALNLSRPFDMGAREEVERTEWGDQDYGREHLYAMAVWVYEEIERRESTRRAWQRRVWHGWFSVG